MRTMPLISLVIPNFDGARWIGRSIASALAQTYGDLELLVVDDGSQDASLDVIASFADERIKVDRQDHASVCAARKLGIAHARGDLVAFPNSDDTWSPAFLERLSAALAASPGAALAYCGWQNVGYEGGSGKPLVPPICETAGKLEAVFWNSRWPIHAALTRREAVRADGAFDLRFPTSEDILLWLKILAAGKIVRVPDVLAFYHYRPGRRATADEVRLAFNHLDAQRAFLDERPDARNRLGRDKVRDHLTYGELLRRRNACYWRGDLPNAQRIFRRVMLARCGGATDLKRMLPTLAPLRLHRLLGQRSRGGDPNAGNDAHG